MVDLESLLKTELPRCLDQVKAMSIPPFNSNDAIATAFTLASPLDSALDVQVFWSSTSSLQSQLQR